MALLPGTCRHTSWYGFQPHRLSGQAAYLNPGRKALTVTRLPQAKTAPFRIRGLKVFKSKKPPTCYYVGLAPGTWPYHLAPQDDAQGDSREMQSPKVLALEESLREGVARQGLFVVTSRAVLGRRQNLT